MTQPAQCDLFAWAPRDDGAPPTRADFAGETYSRAHDRERLATVMGSVWRLLRTGRVYTLPELHAAVEADLGRAVLITSISSKARDLRKRRNGSWPVRCKRVGEGGTWRMWMEEGSAGA